VEPSAIGRAILVSSNAPFLLCLLEEGEVLVCLSPRNREIRDGTRSHVQERKSGIDLSKGNSLRLRSVDSWH
jgi:hypothetical protein